jgi:hypothetical protein
VARFADGDRSAHQVRQARRSSMRRAIIEVAELVVREDPLIAQHLA